jgi:transposase
MDFLTVDTTHVLEALVVLGVDTHADTHVAVALDGLLGRRLGSKTTSSATDAGYAELVAWAEGLGRLDRVGVEGSVSFGVGLARFLRARGVPTVEVNRPNRQHRRRFGKHDTADAEAAARAVQAKSATGRALPAERYRRAQERRRSRGDGGAHPATGTTFCAQGAHSSRQPTARAARYRSGRAQDRTARPLHSQACCQGCALPFGRPSRRPAGLDQVGDEIHRPSLPAALRGDRRARGADRTLSVQRVSKAVPALTSLRGVGTDTAASLLVAVGDNPERLKKSEASFARLCGVAPVAASSGKTSRHRLNRGGNRDANRALHVLALGRMSWDERTREYVAKRTAEGKSRREILRCLKRYLAREVYRVLLAAGTPTSSLSRP